jgi:hypothetical protein
VEGNLEADERVTWPSRGARRWHHLLFSAAGGESRCAPVSPPAELRAPESASTLPPGGTGVAGVRRQTLNGRDRRGMSHPSRSLEGLSAISGAPAAGVLAARRQPRTAIRNCAGGAGRTAQVLLGLADVTCSRRPRGRSARGRARKCGTSRPESRPFDPRPCNQCRYRDYLT